MTEFSLNLSTHTAEEGSSGGTGEDGLIAQLTNLINQNRDLKQNLEKNNREKQLVLWGGCKDQRRTKWVNQSKRLFLSTWSTRTGTWREVTYNSITRPLFLLPGKISVIKENRIYIRVEFTRKKCKTAILLYCFHTAGVIHIFLYNLLGSWTHHFIENLKLISKENQIIK